MRLELLREGERGREREREGERGREREMQIVFGLNLLEEQTTGAERKD
jgi:hypothetical protein